MEKTISVETTKRGFPAMWESGGSMSNTGRAVIIMGRNGEPRKPVYLRRRGHLACEHHALITIHEGYYFVEVSHHRGDFRITVWKINSVSSSQDEDGQWRGSALVEQVNRFDRGEWDAPLNPMLEPAVEAARGKVLDYHCKRPHYIAAF